MSFAGTRWIAVHSVLALSNETGPAQTRLIATSILPRVALLRFINAEVLPLERANADFLANERTIYDERGSFGY